MDANRSEIEYEKVQTSKLAIVSLILGITSILLSCVMGGFLFGIPGVIVSLVAMGHVKKNCMEGQKLAISGLITSAIAILCSILTITIVVGGYQSIRNNMMKKYDVLVGEEIARCMKFLYEDPFEEEAEDLQGTRVVLDKDGDAEVPPIVQEYLFELWTQDNALEPRYTENGANAYVVEFDIAGSVEVYITNGDQEWEIYPDIDEEYR